MKRCITRYFGNMEYLDESVLHFPDGLPGFDCEHNFLPIQQPESAPLVYLQSLTSPDLCFVALPATVACRDYQPLLSEHDAELLESTPEQIGRLLTLVLLSIAENRLTANLLAPVVVNVKLRRAVQAIDPEARYSHQALLPTLEEAPC